MEEREERDGELFKERLMTEKSRKEERSSTGKKIQPLRMKNLDINGDPAQDGRDDSAHCSHGKTKCQISAGKRRNAVANGQGVCNMMKKAWGEDENERESRSFSPPFNSKSTRIQFIGTA